MIPLQTGPCLALDASSSGDSYFVKIKLKSISNMPAVPGGGRGEGTRGASRAEGLWPRLAAGQLGERAGDGGVWFGRRLEGWASLCDPK